MNPVVRLSGRTGSSKTFTHPIPEVRTDGRQQGNRSGRYEINDRKRPLCGFRAAGLCGGDTGDEQSQRMRLGLNVILATLGWHHYSPFVPHLHSDGGSFSIPKSHNANASVLHSR